MKKSYEYHIGIDPGVNTGIAVWNSKEKKFETIFTCGILQAMEKISPYPVFHSTLFTIEDPNKRIWFGNSGREKLQGAGSIKRDFSIWEEWFKANCVDFIVVAPKDVKTKLDADKFKAFTKCELKTNQHGRDAAMMVFGK